MSPGGRDGNGGLRAAEERKGQDVHRKEEEEEQVAASPMGSLCKSEKVSPSPGRCNTWPGYRAWRAWCRLAFGPLPFSCSAEPSEGSRAKAARKAE